MGFGSIRLALAASTALSSMFISMAARAETQSEAAMPPPANSAEIPDIVVTAEKSSATVQKTPISIAVVDGEKLRDQARSSLDDVLKNVTGVEVQGAGRGLQVAIRGIGSNLPPGIGESATATNFDGVYNLRAESGQLGYFDIDRVEVLRGPQSTLYGRNSTGGVVNIVTADPEIGQFYGRATLTAGNYNLLSGEAAVNVPLSDTLAARVALTSINRDGYIADGHDDQVGTAGRIKLLAEPSDAIRIIFGAEAVKLGGHGPGNVQDALYNSGDYWGSNYPDIASQRYRSIKLWADATISVGPGELHVLPAWQHAEGSTFGFNSRTVNSNEDPKSARQVSVEVRYQNRPGAPLKWTVGYYHYNYRQSSESATGAYNITSGDFTIPTALTSFANGGGNSNAVFGQVTVPVTDTLRVIGGYRHTWDERSMDGIGVGTRAPFDNAIRGNFNDYRAGLEYEPTQNIMAYATFATAFRPGGINNFDGSLFQPEHLNSYEVGFKTRWLGSRLQINGDIYYYDYEDFQQGDFYITSSGLPLSVFRNADARNFGQELEVLALPSSRDRINISILHMATRILSDLIMHPDPFTPVNVKGMDMPTSPHWTIKGGYEHTFDFADGALTPRIDARYVGEQKVTPLPIANTTQEAYFSGDASLTWKRDGYSISGWIKNFTNEAVKRFYAPDQVFVAAPRTYGATLSANF